MKFCVVSYDEIQRCNYTPEPDTTNLKNPNGTWYVLKDGDKIVSCLRIYKNEIKSVYTVPEYRKKGCMSALIKAVTELYRHEVLRAHCLKSSYPIFASNGFKLKKVIHFQDGPQFRCERAPDPTE